jgi:hypothetical protein
VELNHTLSELCRDKSVEVEIVVAGAADFHHISNPAERQNKKGCRAKTWSPGSATISFLLYNRIRHEH